MRRRGTIAALATAALITTTFLLWKPEQTVVGKEKLNAFQKYQLKKKHKREAGYAKADAPGMNGTIELALRTQDGADGPTYGPNQIAEEFLKAKSNIRATGGRSDQPLNELNFVERGPGNVAGRTRALLIDPDDETRQTWIAGSASGGIWKTTDGGDTWAFISEDIPNLGTNTLAMSAANSSVIYAGTGEHFTRDVDGSGLYKSIDKGQSWVQVADPSVYNDFKNVSRIVVDPDDENVVIVTTRNSRWTTTGLEAAIYKTTDGGDNWTRLRSSTFERYDDIAYDPNDFNTLYVAIEGIGVIKSTDGGTTWNSSSTGMTPSGRVEIAISPVNSNRLWASAQGNVSSAGSDLYVTSDAGATWSLAINSSGVNEDFLGGQGWYDNVATAHPFDEDIVYIGGVDLWKFELTETGNTSLESVEVSENGTEAFMDYINHGGAYLGGSLDIGTVAFDDLLSIEVRFGQGTQKAHRFTVGGQGAGVPSSGYIYEDYVEVPFQVWDTENNVQLMASFRDQQEDGEWNLIASNTDGDATGHSREYLYFHNIPYSETANSSIAQNAGIDAGQMYFVWPVLRAGASFDKDNLPTSNLAVEIVSIAGVERITSVVSDAYGGGVNNFSSQATRAEGIHPDQHNLIIADTDPTTEEFNYFVTNDGGVYISITDDDPGTANNAFTYVSHGYNTTQFYGADKAPGDDRYIGGTQDNGTWYHPPGTTGSADADAIFGIGGDGFEALWHSTNVNKIIGGSQFNNFAKTENGGTTWTNATNGFTDNGPFRSRLAHHKSRPDTIFTVGSQGVWRSRDFGDNWERATMNDPSLWSFSNSCDVEVSYANHEVIWAGATLSSGSRLAVSTDGGVSFDAVENYEAFNMGAVSGIGTHPTDDKIAYALFSFQGLPKVIKTVDQGQTWDDISGYDGTGDRGFPDVAVNCLFVFPTDENRIWVGSEIGIIESLDGGDSWALLDSNMPYVNVHDFKLSENQIVIATYGRGIWSVEIDGILVIPTFQNAYMSPDGKFNYTIKFSFPFDSTEVYLDDALIKTIYDNDLGSTLETLESQGQEGTLNLRLDPYFDGDKYRSSEIELPVFQTNDIAASYGTDFIDAQSDFTGTDFEVVNQGLFLDEALHSPHPYAIDRNYVTYLRTPVTVSETNSMLTYRDVALIEAGESGSEFGDSDFYDYVVVEASNNGLDWIPLEDGYDMDLYGAWRAAVNRGEDGNPDLFEDHEINLLDHFEVGDNILIRFRLFSDPGTVEYGWVLDDLYIQEERPLSVGPKSQLLEIYPNPASEFTTIKFNQQIDQTLEVFNLNGQRIEELKVESNQTFITWNVGHLPTGVYVIRYQEDGNPLGQKIMIR